MISLQASRRWVQKEYVYLFLCCLLLSSWDFFSRVWVSRDNQARSLNFTSVDWQTRVSPYQFAQVEQAAASLLVVPTEPTQTDSDVQQLQHQFGDVSVRLLAIYQEQQTTAIFSVSGLPEQVKPILRVQEGQLLGAVEIVAITANAVTVRFEQQETILQLFKPQSAGLTAAGGGKPRE